MEKIRLLEEAMNMLEVVEGTWAVQNLRNQVPTIIEHIVKDSLGESNGGWVDESIRLLRPRCREDSFAYGEEMLRTYTQIMNVYDHIAKNAKYKTLDMTKFRDSIRFYARYLNMFVRVPCKENIIG